MNIYQMQLSYLAQEDRIIMKVNSKKNEEVQLFLTRRIVIAFWNILNKTIDHTLSNKPKFNDMQQVPVESLSNTARKSTPKQMKQEIQNQIHHQDIINESDYETPFKEGGSFPMEKVPILVEKITINTYDNSGIALIFTSTQKSEISLNLNTQILHNLSDLLIKVLPATDWNIGLMDKTNVVIHEKKAGTALH